VALISAHLLVPPEMRAHAEMFFRLDASPR